MTHPSLTLLALLPCPLLIVAAAALLRPASRITRAAAILMWLQLGIVVCACSPQLLPRPATPELSGGFAIDRPAAILLILTTIVAVSSLTHAIGYFEREDNGPHPAPPRHISQFYVCTALFLLAMYGVIAAQNLGYLWVAMEATTVLSAPLVFHHRSKTALEATWKYLIICSVGIAFALFGTAVLYAASQQIVGLPYGSLLLPDLLSHARHLPHGLLRLGFIFLLLGYGTKAGLFPLHNWLPDAHSEAPAPASAMLSGALLNCALLALWRVSALLRAAGEGRLVEQTLLPMGVLTVATASLFLLRQRDLKRLLAYSTMENVGVMAVAIGLGSSSGFLLQAINHSLAKVALFLIAGNLLQIYGLKDLASIRAVLTRYPVQAVCFLLGALAAAGTPPFGSFLSEWSVLATAADTGHITAVVATAIGLAIAFIALSGHAAAMLFGEPAERDVQAAAHPSGKGMTSIPAMLLLLSLYLGLSLTPGLIAVMKNIVW